MFLFHFAYKYEAQCCVYQKVETLGFSYHQIKAGSNSISVGRRSERKEGIHCTLDHGHRRTFDLGSDAIKRDPCQSRSCRWVPFRFWFAQLQELDWI